MNRSLDVSFQETYIEQIVSDELYPYLKSFFCILTLIFSVSAVCFNAINVFIFCKIGVTDSITVCFLHLAVCDFCTMVCLSVFTFFTLLYALSAPGSKYLSTQAYAISITYSLGLDIGATTTTYIALQRGLCVAWPFLTRHAFTRNRSLIVLITTTVFLVACWIPRAFTFRYVEISDPKSNSSKILIVEFFGLFNEFYSFNLIFVKIILGFTQYAIMSVCAVAIFIGMKSSIRLKSFSKSGAPDPHNSRSNQKSLDKTDMNEKKVAGHEKTEEDSSNVNSEAKMEKDKKAPQKELLVIKQALTVVLLQIFCATPGITVFIYSMLDPKFQIGTEYNNLFFLVYGVVDMSYALNAFTNFFIYLNFNTKFRQCLHSVFHCGTGITNRPMSKRSRN
ncbi:chemosensory receptor c [Plakobranchus ocellatus]|uniref:Chemosensory receptor c n=1 Tax=Plakobranchus ocellatus TaxID=259542 RepID=A0AAV3XU64_9GAST|nr:chemosensory receptor c [Plakobranchus ocellatus]